MPLSKLNIEPEVILQNNKQVVLFDGECKLCHFWVRFIIKYDKARKFKLCNVQSDKGQILLQHFGLSCDDFETMVYINEQQAYLRSEAFFRVIRFLPYRIKWLLVFQILPKRFNDWFYDRVARNRYRLFGKFDYCLLPSADHNERFL